MHLYTFCVFNLPELSVVYEDITFGPPQEANPSPVHFFVHSWSNCFISRDT